MLKFLPKNTNNFFLPNPVDSSFETLNNFNQTCDVDVFFALSHGVHRGILKKGKEDDRSYFLKKLTREEKIATYFEFFSEFFCFPCTAKIKKAPISGIKIIAESIGKFI